jgi:NAD(P)-dependent dehydrogenase (short-subunit alcohol dehydrogenase family)
MAKLEGKTALVTGGTAGIGLAAVRRFAEEGAHVVVTGRRQEPLDAVAGELGSAVTTVRGDVSSHEDLDRVMAVIGERGSGIDVLFANAGGGEFAALADITWQHFADTFNGNVGGTVFTVQKALPLLNRGASVILAGSSIDIKGAASFSVYAATKAAIRSFARSWAVELMDRSIRVNVIAPGGTNTPGLAGLAPAPEQADGLLEALASGVPMQRLSDPAEIASAVVFLASDQSSFMTGAELYVDGGTSQI